MRTKEIILFLFVLFTITANAQTERKSIRQGNNEFKKNDFTSSEISYRKALEKNPSSYKANFNLADALYKQDKQDEAIKQLEGLSSSKVNDLQKSNVYYNMGNSYLKQQKLKESIDSYKKALRLNPNDNEAKYNLAEAQRKLKQQQQQQQNDKNNKDNKDNKDNKNKDKDKDKKDQDKKNDKDKNKQNQNQDKKDQQQQQQQQKISQEDARRILEAIQNKEKETQQKMKEEQVKAAKVRVDKNW